MHITAENNPKYPSIAEIAGVCYEKLANLPKAGKPNANEWTVLAGIVQFDAFTEQLQVVGLGCGTKCLGGSQLCRQGLALNDAHAEVLARRSFIRYLYHELNLTIKGEPSIFTWNDSEHLFELKANLSFHFISTQTPCGDACIIGEEEEQEVEEESVPAKRLRLDSASAHVYTGAKLIGSEHTDAMQQTIGAIRIKPGRGDRTLSVSCSDKLAKWNVLGLQGALLDAHLKQPIYLKTMNFCCGSDVKALERAIYKRWPSISFNNSHFQRQTPDVRVDSTLLFEYAESATRLEPSAAGIAWCYLPEILKPHEIIVKGMRQGITKKQLNTPRAAVQISRYYLMRYCLELLDKQPVLLQNLNGTLTLADIKSLTYYDLKQLSQRYQESWRCLKLNYFKQWTEKPKDINDFKLNNVDAK